MKKKLSTTYHTVRPWLSTHRKQVFVLLGVAMALTIVTQIIYPNDRLPLYATVDGVNLSGWPTSDATKRLDSLAGNKTLKIILGNTGQTFNAVKPATIGLTISNKHRLERADYPLYMRLIPGSILWFGPLQTEQPPEYTFDDKKVNAYAASIVGEDCKIAPKNATLRLSGNELVVETAKLGGSCNYKDVITALKGAKPAINAPLTITLPVKSAPSDIDNSSAQTLANTLNKNSLDGVTVKVAGKEVTIPRRDVLSWLEFTASGKKLTFTVSAKKSKEFLAKNISSLVTKPAGLTKVTTLDFTETSRLNGATGQTLATDATLGSVKDVLNGKIDTAIASTTIVQPAVKYTRSYTKTSTGIAAQMKHYDDDNAGTFGASFTELGGRGLSAQYNGDRQFVTASTYKLFVAFSTLRRVDAGKMKWTDGNIANGRNLSECFDDMIVKSDNACAEALIKKIGARELNADIKLLGLTNSGFFASNNLTTPNDLARYLTMLQNSQLPIKPDSRSRLLGAMKRNVYRQGIPAGTSGETADKVGFLWGLLHDAAIVYSPKGTYVLVVMTDGSTWGNIADLTKKIEALR